MAQQSLRRENYPNWIDAVLLLAAFFALAMVSGALFGRLQGLWGLSTGLTTCLSYAGQFVTLLALSLWWRSWRTGGEQRGLSFAPGSLNFTQVLWATVVISASGVVVEPLLDLLPEEFLDALSSLMGHGGWMMFTAVLLAPFFEEALFRGVVQDSLTRRYGPLRGIVLASALFGIVHLIPQQALNAFLVGLVLGYVYWSSGSLTAVVLIHLLNNAIAYFTWLLSGEKIVSTRELLPGDTAYHILYGVSALIVAGAFAAMFLSLRRSAHPKAGEDSDASDTKAPD